ncbi:TFIIE alpha subunit-domain-containing protein, partial [Lipomyces japonicus]|uniref:TFIIE alpha subunit-domain-containing protein n=1 Tax=Lipomyces japonicus TaxID=56871 RepID=UPI0034CD69C0
MEDVKTLIQYVSRSFYETRHIIILDAILRHVVISDDEMPSVVGIQKKELHKLCARLREDRLLKVHTRSEPKEGQQRPVQRTYYYIQYREAVDSIKWRIHKLGETFNERMTNDVDRQGYACPFCHRRYAAMEVLPLQATDLSGFICADCGHVLQDDDDSDEIRIGQERLARLMSQIRRVIDTLKRIDDSFIPDNDFDSSLKHAVPIISSDGVGSDLSSSASALSSQFRPLLPFASKDVNQSALSIEFDLTSGDDESGTAAKAAAKAAAAKAAKEQAEKNALPIWHLESTVGQETGKEADEQRASEFKKSKANAVATPVTATTVTATTDTVLDAAAEDVIAAYYNSLNAQKDEEEDDDDDEEEEEDDDEFGEME